MYTYIYMYIYMCVYIYIYIYIYLHPKTFKDFRGISLLSVLAKWYMGGLMELIRDWVSTSTAGRWTSLMVFGFEPAHSPEMVQAGLNLLLQKGTEWSQQLPIFVSSSDVLSAFDYLTPEAVQEAAMYWDMPPDLIAAMAQETVGLSCGASLLSLETSSDIPLTACERQGGVETTWKWNMVMRMVLHMLEGQWVAWGMGVELPIVARVTHLLWADKVFLLSHNKEHLAAMLQMLTDMLASYGLRWKRQSLSYTHSLQGS